MQIKKFSAVSAALVAGLGLAGAAHAGSSNGSMLVSATVLDNCTVIATPMAFGAAITGLGSADIDSTSTLTLACTPNANYNVALDNGSNALSGARRMKGTVRGEFLPYEIYTSSAHATRWGQTRGTDTVGGTATGGIASLTAYGRIAKGTSAVSADAYTDTVTVTVNF